MEQNRRDVLRIASIMGLAVAAGLIKPGEAWAQAQDWNKSAFDAKNLGDTVKALGGSNAAASSAVQIEAPDIAENGAVVPVAVSSTLPNVQQIAIVVEKNPAALSGTFAIPAGTEPYVATRVKMAQTSNVHALVKADGKWFVATKEIKVTLGGCGG
ncbi:thiosulfate oxidation carrier protein SoxY [Undibacterium terreum]|uniref:Thiosulfate oxidation carrier protein SoxY n=1 Tax=Undibacterium terreum TaxID=1224302 RepID=A0A916UU77_9BURK|nr:thiosulfate oxidation carrier protein SoxY [Undibacterium terreum]GGC88022.1 thiosulfate oxidation carrier protein SoxY [Undibacterium terreum]